MKIEVVSKLIKECEIKTDNEINEILHYLLSLSD
jgi:hypothetical protein